MNLRSSLKKVISFLLVTTFLIVLISGCGTEKSSQENTSQSNTSANTGQSQEPPTTPSNVAPPSSIPTIIKKDPTDMLWMRDISPITLTAFINRVVGEEFKWGNDETTKYITERTGVTLDIEYAPDSEGTRLNLMMASGERLPDLIGHVHQTTSYARDLISGGYVLCAEDLINEYAPEYWNIFPGDFQKQMAASGDGKMWAFADGYDLDGESPYGYMHGYFAVRSDILEAMGKTNLDIKTLDDFYSVLEEFSKIKDQFPEVQYPVYLKGIRSQFAAIFGEVSTGDIKYDTNTDSLYFWFQNQAGYNTLKMFNKLYRDGYLKEESIISTNDVIDDLGAGKAFFFFENNVWQSSSANPPLQQNVNQNAWYMPCYPFSAVGEKTLRTFKGVSHNGSAWWISADCTNVKRALGFLEYMSTEEGMLTVNCGIYGTHWDVDRDSEGKLYPKFIGEAGELAHSGKHVDAKKKFGFNNYESGLWLYHEARYNFLWNHDVNFANSILPENMLKARTIWYYETTDNKDLTGVPNMVQVDGSTDAGVLLSTLRNIYNSELVKIVFSDNNDTFESRYQDMLASLKKAGEDKFWQLYRPLFDEKLELYRTIVGQ